MVSEGHFQLGEAKMAIDATEEARRLAAETPARKASIAGSTSGTAPQTRSGPSNEMSPAPSERKPLSSANREQSLSRLLIAYVMTGLVFMLIPGTLLGVVNLISISSGHSTQSVGAAWIQAHGHAQIFGWIGTFILGIGFYSIPKVRRLTPFAVSDAWICWAFWTAGVLLRWLITAYLWHWRLLLPVSATLELLAFLMFFRSVAGHRPTDGKSNGFEPGLLLVIGGTVGLLLTLILNGVESFRLAIEGTSPAFPHDFDQRFLALVAWGFLVPFVWGFTSRWMPSFIGLRRTRAGLLPAAFAIDALGVASAMAGYGRTSAVFLAIGAVGGTYALRMFEAPEREAKTRGVSASFPYFIRVAYAWLIGAALIGVWAGLEPGAAGIAGASRHALTVGFLSTMVLTVGQRVLPAFCGMHALFSTRMMFASLALLSTGCLLRVSSEIIAYQGYGPWAWPVLPVSAIIELTAITLFAVNLAVTLASPPIVEPIRSGETPSVLSTIR